MGEEVSSAEIGPAAGMPVLVIKRGGIRPRPGVLLDAEHSQFKQIGLAETRAHETMGKFARVIIQAGAKARFHFAGGHSSAGDDTGFADDAEAPGKERALQRAVGGRGWAAGRGGESESGDAGELGTVAGIGKAVDPILDEAAGVIDVDRAGEDDAVRSPQFLGDSSDIVMVRAFLLTAVETNAATAAGLDIAVCEADQFKLRRKSLCLEAGQHALDEEIERCFGVAMLTRAAAKGKDSEGCGLLDAGCHGIAWLLSGDDIEEAGEGEGPEQTAECRGEEERGEFRQAELVGAVEGDGAGLRAGDFCGTPHL